MERVESLTDKKQMKLNTKKTKNMIFNFSKNNQFSTEIRICNEVIETVKETKLLGTTITSDLSWNKNTDKVVKETNKRMQLLHKASKFTNNTKDLKQIYMLQIRSKLDQSAVVWHSSLTNRNRTDLERVQKSAVKLILGTRYDSYVDALKILGLETLDKRRERICLKFSKQCLKLSKMKDLFPKYESGHPMQKRNSCVYQGVRSFTERFRKSAIPSMLKMLNDYEAEKHKKFKQLDSIVPVNYVCNGPHHCDNKNIQ